MNDEQRKILDMVEQGIITSEDAARLLKALDGGPAAPQKPAASPPPPAAEPASGFHDLRRLGKELQEGAAEAARLAMEEAKKALKGLGKIQFPTDSQEAENILGANWEQEDEDFREAQSSPLEYPLMAGELENLNIQWIRGNVELRPTEGGEIRITEYSRMPLEEGGKTVVTREDGELSIAWGKEKMRQGVPYSKHLLVELPENCFHGLEELEIKSIAGNIRLQGFSAENITLSQVSGRIEVSELHAEELKLSAVSGQITARDLQAEDLDISGVSGEVGITGFHAEDANLRIVTGSLNAFGDCDELSLDSVSGLASVTLNRLPEEANVHTVSGRSVLYLPDSEDGFTVNYHAKFGAFHCDFPLTGELNAKSGEGAYGDGDAEIDMNAISGAVELRRA